MTINNLAIFVPTNGSSTSTFKSRKNGANGNLSISVSANGTGLFQDISHSDSVVAGDDFDYTFSPGNNQFEPIFAYADFSNSNGDAIFSCGNDEL